MDTNKILIILLIVILLIMLFQSHVTIIHTSPPGPKPTPVPVPIVVKPIGGCAGTRYGCCPNGVTARMNPAGTNC
jgi:hypothetical protein